MNHSVEIQIKKCENSLKEAMLQSNISELDKLLADDLIFTNHLGHVMTKQDDLNAHKTKALKINEIKLNDMNIKTFSSIAIVTVKAHISGSFNGESAENDFRFTRVWNKTENESWQITAVHSSVVV